jgi:putative peptidoglycan lipid II flippase
VLSKQLFKSTIVVSGMTLISRILGFVRDMLIAQIFGAGLATDAFFVAFKIPNFLRRLFAEGAFAHAFVPVLEDYKQQDDKFALRDFIDKTSGTLALTLMLLAIIGTLAAPLFILLLAPGFAWNGTQAQLAAQLLQITFPYLFFITLVAFSGAILNAHGKFAIPALTPVFLNLCMIAAAIWLSPLMDEPVIGLAWGVFAAGVVQVIFQIPALIRLGLLPRFKVDFYHAGVRRVMRLMLPAIFSVSVTQINLLLDSLFASFLTVGSVSWLYYSDRLVEFPLGIIGMALATVILPQLARNYAAEDKQAFSGSLDWGLRLILLVGMPATVGLLILAEPMLSTLFQYDEFSVRDMHFAGQSLRAYAVGLMGYFMIKILVPGFTSRQDMKTPVRYGMYAMVVSLGLNLMLVFPLAHAGLALATSLGALFNGVLLLRKLMLDKVYQPLSGWWLFLLRVILACAVMAACLGYWLDMEQWSRWDASQRVINLLQWILIGGLIYIGMLFMTGLRPNHLILKQ